MRDLQDKVAVVTGGANGIGLALVRSFLAEGMRVAIADVDPAALEDVEKEFAGQAGVLIHATDVTSAASVGVLADAVYERLGACHLLCNNAGVGTPSSKVWLTTLNDWSWVFGVNVTGVVNGILTFVPRMIDSGEEGYVVNTSSGDGPIAPMPSASVYAGQQGRGLGVDRMPGRATGRGRPADRRLRLLSLRGSPAHRTVDVAPDPPARTGPRAPTRDGAMTPEKLEEMASQAGARSPGNPSTSWPPSWSRASARAATSS